ncbi:MAG: hypothetical protein K2M12_01655 [Muribaculaceae bacterium]|nr:hypothetical protein [Muribaculaceae bacterium]
MALVLSAVVLCAVACTDQLEKDRALVFTGDSIIARWPVDQSFPSQQVYNHGKSGAGISYIEEQEGKFRGSDVVVMIGTNDHLLFYSDDKTDGYVENYLRAVAGLTDGSIYLFSILPREFHSDLAGVNTRISLINNKIKEASAAYPRVRYVDVYDMFLDGDHINYQFYSDGLHLNGYGYEVLTAQLLKAIY